MILESMNVRYRFERTLNESHIIIAIRTRTTIQTKSKRSGIFLASNLSREESKLCHYIITLYRATLIHPKNYFHQSSITSQAARRCSASAEYNDLLLLHLLANYFFASDLRYLRIRHCIYPIGQMGPSHLSQPCS